MRDQEIPSAFEGLSLKTEEVNYGGKESPAEQTVITDELGTWREATAVRQGSHFCYASPLSTAPWPDKTTNLVKAAQTFALDCVGSDFPTSLFLAKTISLYDV